MNTYCLPVAAEDGFMLQVTEQVSEMATYFDETAAAWLVLLMSGVVAGILGLAYVCLLRCFAGIFIWSVILGFMGCLAGLGYLFYSDHSAL